MASISRRVRADGSTGWQVQIRTGGKSASHTFDSKTKAEAFAKSMEHHTKDQWRNALYKREETFHEETFSDCAQLYQSCPQSTKYQKYIVKAVSQHMKSVKMGEITPSFVKKFIKTMSQKKTNRNKPYQWTTISFFLSAISVVYQYRATDYDLTMPHGLFSTKKFPKNWRKDRERRLEDAEYDTLIALLNQNQKDDLAQFPMLIDLALETGARLQELILAEFQEFDLNQFLWSIPAAHTKGNYNRFVPLSDRAVQIVQLLLQSKINSTPRMFHTIKSAITASQSFSRLVKQAGIENLHFHDLRHEAISRMVLYRMNLSVFEIMKIVGHKSINMLNRYANLRPAELIDRFRSSDTSSISRN
ncbi:MULTISPECIES: site-specific integrase [unclassified Herbaspirillum]|uniref:site-specific integrase n=1 Tax=unclassified Herbaspirillum TaxID=2624150 RepID=UPI000E2E7995|nr:MULTISPECIES: site-specific integrase [unclassified Herbaspirillum]RFB72943.1 site-specific integrase [Herbaspirillum sp. 3R-3a1]TFI11248.1 site-specific integrase [Herbaspirillum sp. 3R11]TFI17156.1 site-specific integrase [Herbaspirillum sp. 3R-11]TFI28889.1 site-specific integrase [Herbaspirillum sp. 3C11]